MSDDQFPDDDVIEEVYDDEVNATEVGKGARVILPPAFYLFLVNDVNKKSRDDGSPYYMLDLQAAQSSKGDAMNGEVQREFLNLGSEERDRMRRLAFALGTGLTTREVVDACKAEGRGNPIDYRQAVGQYVVAEVAAKQVKQRDEQGNDIIGRNGKAIWVDDPKGDTHVPYDRFYHPSDPMLAKRGFKIDPSRMQTVADPYSSGGTAETSQPPAGDFD